VVSGIQDAGAGIEAPAWARLLSLRHYVYISTSELHVRFRTCRHSLF